MPYLYTHPVVKMAVIFLSGYQNLTVQVSVSAVLVDATRKRVERTVSTDSDSIEVDVGDVTTG